MIHVRNLAAVLLLIVPVWIVADEIVGKAGNETLFGTSTYDRFLGGPGGDLFVIDLNPGRPDEILDFSPEEGDGLLLDFENPRIPLDSFDVAGLSLNSRGVLRYRINNENIPLVDLGRADLTFEVKPAKKRYELKFRLKTL